MNKKVLLIVWILTLMPLMSNAQVSQVFSQDFESGSPVNYTLSDTNSLVQSSIYSGGSHAMKLTQASNDDVVITFDTIDFTADASWNYFTFEFMHIAFVDPRDCIISTGACIIEAKRPDQTSWTRLNNDQYNTTEGGSTEFQSLASFSLYSYVDWSTATAPSNLLWKHERFDVEQLFQGVPTSDRKLIIRMTVEHRKASASRIALGSSAWYIDDVKLSASEHQIVQPVITMRAFPDALDYPSSSGAKLIAEVTTNVYEGIDPDSVYCIYRVGNSPIEYRTYLHRDSSNSIRYEGRIPFYGYGTLMHYHICAKDASSDHVAGYFPRNSSQWKTYRCVRGRTNTGTFPGTQTNNSSFPFPSYADSRSEFVYDSATMAQLGYGPGCITTIRFIMADSSAAVTRQHLQFRMGNASNFARTLTQETFTRGMQVVFDSTFTIPQHPANTYLNVTLQDTFYYAGGDLVVQCLYDAISNLPFATTVKHIPADSGKLSLVTDGYNAYYGCSPFGDGSSFFETGIPTDTRPWIQFFEVEDEPAVIDYDCGVSSVAFPSNDTVFAAGMGNVQVWLQNYGVNDINSVRIAYRVDDEEVHHQVWTGALSTGETTCVRFDDSQTFTEGAHTIVAWVEDSTRVGDSVYLDYDSFNDTASASFTCNTVQSISEVQTDAVSFKLYPNPTTGQSRLLGPIDKVSKIEVYDIAGRLRTSFSSPDRFDVSALPTGSYFVRIVTTDRQQYHLKLFKK